MTNWFVRLTCDACLSHANAVAQARQCDRSPTSIYIQVEGAIGMWMQSHHEPHLEVLGPAIGVR